jgi:hypothetical protein
MIDTLVHSASSHLVQSTLFAGAAAFADAGIPRE